MIEEVHVTLTVASRRGATTSILQGMDTQHLDESYKIETRETNSSIIDSWERSSLILLGTPTYMSRRATEPHYPTLLRNYRRELEEVQGKDIILFGSGRTEYEHFCGSLDFLEEMLSNRNQILKVFKFEGMASNRERERFSHEVTPLIADHVRTQTKIRQEIII